MSCSGPAPARPSGRPAPRCKVEPSPCSAPAPPLGACRRGECAVPPPAAQMPFVGPLGRPVPAQPTSCAAARRMRRRPCSPTPPPIPRFPVPSRGAHPPRPAAAQSCNEGGGRWRRRVAPLVPCILPPVHAPRLARCGGPPLPRARLPPPVRPARRRRFGLRARAACPGPRAPASGQSAPAARHRADRGRRPGARPAEPPRAHPCPAGDLGVQCAAPAPARPSGRARPRGSLPRAGGDRAGSRRRRAGETNARRRILPRTTRRPEGGGLAPGPGGRAAAADAGRGAGEAGARTAVRRAALPAAAAPACRPCSFRRAAEPSGRAPPVRRRDGRPGPPAAPLQAARQGACAFLCARDGNECMRARPCRRHPGAGTRLRPRRPPRPRPAPAGKRPRRFPLLPPEPAGSTARQGAPPADSSTGPGRRVFGPPGRAAGPLRLPLAVPPPAPTMAAGG